MTTPFSRAPHVEGATAPGAHALNAALLIDFDNVTMGMRSDLAKELKTLLNSDIIKGKVTVQRAYADWRRYPQYIVPLSEASIDLIFAPAYGSSKKNATDIRMAIDGMELIFIRPEIGTYILLTGDSDFSSLVLKLKEYGKYVIGIGIQESSSDILVQNCDEYYSYTSLAGLRKTSDLEHQPLDPWATVEQALERMVARDDVMRSDRLKQVMLELDPGFDEKSYGFSKFSKFLAEASSRNLINLKKLENGQYEVSPSGGASLRTGEVPEARPRRAERTRGRRSREGRGGRKADQTESAGTPETSAAPEDPLSLAYDLLRSALGGLKDNGRDAVRDSDVKRKMLEIDGSFDETELGFPKFSRFLRQAHEQGVVALTRMDKGNFEVTLPGGSPPEGADDQEEDAPPSRRTPTARGARARKAVEEPVEARRVEPDEASQAEVEAAGPPADEAAGARSGRGVRARRGSKRGKQKGEGPPPLLEGQVAGRQSRSAPLSSGPPSGAVDVKALGLPSEPDAMVRYLTSRYKGVGQKTAETVVSALGRDLFQTLHADPDRLGSLVPAKRAEQLLNAWRADFDRRSGTGSRPAGDDTPARGGDASSDDGREEAPAGDGARRRRRGTRRGARGKAAD
jgi:uncharacterized protein (TIGR00288 family)